MLRFKLVGCVQPTPQSSNLYLQMWKKTTTLIFLKIRLKKKRLKNTVSVPCHFIIQKAANFFNLIVYKLFFGVFFFMVRQNSNLEACSVLSHLFQAK